jgi:hypothetical protein
MAGVINLAALTKYTDQLAIELISKAVLRGRTQDTGITIQPDVKYKAALNLMTSTLKAAATTCGISATGSVVLSQRDLEVCPLTVFEDICLNDLEQYWAGKLMNKGSYNETIPFEQLYTEDKVKKIQALIEDLFWKGSKSGDNVTGQGAASGNLALCDGILDILQFTSATSSVLTPGITASFTKATAIDIIDSIINKFNSDASDALGEENINIYISYPNFTLLTQALRDANFFHYDANQGDFRINGYLGTQFNLIAVRGLNGSNRIVMTPASNLYMGVDLFNDYETFEVFYHQKDDTVYFRSKWKIGAQVAFPEFVVLYKI